MGKRRRMAVGDERVAVAYLRVMGNTEGQHLPPLQWPPEPPIPLGGGQDAGP